jgi:ribose transport system ATP-binding protein
VKVVNEHQGPAEAVVMRNIRKAFGDTQALGGVDLRLLGGEVHALLGENGAGKSTLIKILTGVLRRDDGAITIFGQDVHGSPSPAAMRRLGVRACYQELDLVPGMSVVDNLALGEEPRGRSGALDRDAADARAQRVFEDIGVEIPLHRAVSSLAVAERQLVAIARAIVGGVRILILDEPTSALNAVEAARLFDVIRKLAARDVPVVYVSHRLDDIFEIADTVTVLRDGMHVATRPTKELTPSELISLMTGTEASGARGAKTVTDRRDDEPALVVENLTAPAMFAGINFSVWPGEVVGIAGSLDSGAIDVAATLFGRRKHVSGAIRLEGAPITLRRPQQAVAAGFAFVPEDRKEAGLCLNLTPMANISLTHVAQYVRRGRIDRRLERQQVEKIASRVRLAPTMVHAQIPCGQLSGGSQQKVLLAKWLYRDPKLLILAEPTRGVDVAARADIHAVVREIAARSVPVVLASSDINEIVDVCDRVLVMRRGAIVDELTGQRMNGQAILSSMLGVADSDGSDRAEGKERSVN